MITNSEEYKNYLADNENGVQGVLWFSSPIFGKIHEKLLIPKKNGRKFEFSKEEYEDFKYIIKQRAERIKNGKDINSSTFYYDKNLEKGDPLLFQVKDGKMAEHLAFSEIPRLRYKFSPLDLVPEEFRPGNSLKNLSFSERLFGTTGDTTKKDEEKKDELVALSGRVFFEDAKNYKPEMIDNGNPVTLKAFGEPHPTLTTFYLDNIEKNYNENKGVSIRGRKFYWHHKSHEQFQHAPFGQSIHTGLFLLCHSHSQKQHLSHPLLEKNILQLPRNSLQLDRFHVGQHFYLAPFFS